MKLKDNFINMNIKLLSRLRLGIIYFLWLFLLIELKLSAQRTSIDTTETKHILNKKNLVQQGESYHFYTLLYLYSDIQRAIKYNEKAIAIFKKINHPEGIAKCIQANANIAFTQNNPKKSYEIFQQAILFCDKYNGQNWTKETKYMIFGDLSNVTNFYGDYNESLKYLSDSYEYFKDKDHGTSYNGSVMISDLYITLGKYDESLKYAIQALKQGEKFLSLTKDKHFQGLVLGNYNKIKSLILLNRISEAEIELKQFKKTIDSTGHEPHLFKYYNLSSMIENRKRNYKSAIYNIDEAIKIYKKTGNEQELEIAEFDRAEILIKLKKYNKSKQVFLGLLKNQVGALRVKIYHNLSLIENELNSFKAAYFYSEKSNSLKDSIEVVENTNKAIFWNIKYESEKKQKQIIELENEKYQKDIALQKQNTVIYSLLAGFLIAVLAGSFGYRNIIYRKKLTEQENLQLRQTQQLTATESIIKGQEEERSRLARDLHDGLGGLLSGIKLTLNNMTGNVILSEQNANVFTRALGQLDNAISEMRRVAHSMMPESLLKFGLVDAVNDFCEGISHSGKLKVQFLAIGTENMKLEQSEEITIYRIIQELLNNTLKHADATEAQVQIAKTDELLSITVEDNGKGFDSNQLNKNKGIGIGNIENRVAYLNGKLEVRSELGKGTSTNIEIIQKS